MQQFDGEASAHQYSRRTGTATTMVAMTPASPPTAKIPCITMLLTSPSLTGLLYAGTLLSLLCITCSLMVPSHLSCRNAIHGGCLSLVDGPSSLPICPCHSYYTPPFVILSEAPGRPVSVYEARLPYSSAPFRGRCYLPFWSAPSVLGYPSPSPGRTHSLPLWHPLVTQG